MEIVSLRESPQEVERFIAYFQSRWANVTTREANGRGGSGVGAETSGGAPAGPPAAKGGQPPFPLVP